MPSARVVNLMNRPRAFTSGEKALISKVHGFMPAQTLLDLLNERLVMDLGRDAPRHTMDQLYAEIGSEPSAPADAQDWSGLRKLMAAARRDGTLDKVTRSVIDDFAVVFSLTPAQVLRLQDVLLGAKEDRT